MLDPKHLGRAYHDYAQAFVGRAVSHVVAGTTDDLHRARRAVGRAIRLYMAAGFTQKQAVRKVIALAEVLGALE